jgi:hypothetical protein
VDVRRDRNIKAKGSYISDMYRGITPHDYKLIMTFEKEESSEFNQYESNFILTSKYLDHSDYYETDTLRVYIFDISEFKNDFDLFLKGKYTDFSTRTKGLINLYWGYKEGRSKFVTHPQIEAYLSPTMETYETVARELNVPIDLLLSVVEIVDPPDLASETFTGKGIKKIINELKFED